MGELTIHREGGKKMENGCDHIFQSGLIIASIVLMVIISIAGISSMGFAGILAGPVVVGMGWILFSWIYS